MPARLGYEPALSRIVKRPEHQPRDEGRRPTEACFIDGAASDRWGRIPHGIGVFARHAVASRAHTNLTEHGTPLLSARVPFCRFQ